jgi:glycosyltransferase involved in cell wall biosynthesis
VKGAADAIEALRQLRDRGVSTTLTICGDGPERPALEQEVQNAGLQKDVSFKGWVDSATLAEQYRTAELLLVPSRYEPFGIVALEAIASGCPVVATRTGGLPEAVSNCGLLVPPGDPTALADAVEQALQPEVSKKLRAAMPAHTARHRIDRIATDYLHVLRHVKKPNT